jgi:branched-chain amino acid transport system permease protein
MLAWSLNLVAGYAGLLSLCHAAFYGIGAYISALMMMKLEMGFLPSAIVSILGTTAIGFLIGIPSTRLRGDYFVLVTLGFQIITYGVLNNWVDVTRGPYGLPGIPAPHFLGYEVNTEFRSLLMIGTAALLYGVFIWAITHSPFGRVLKATRDDELAAAALGKNVPRLRLVAFTVSAGLAAVPGVLYAGYMRYIDPTSFMLSEAIFVLSIIIIGGAGTFRGPLVGAAVMVLLPEVLRFLDVPNAVAANSRQIIYGVVIVVLMRFRPRGFLGEYGFE